MGGADDGIWIFAYGSLMWRPDFPHVKARRALLRGYHRALCVYSVRYRGTPERPGLVLGLERGGSCLGRAFRVAAENADAVTAYLDRRELVTDVYIPRWLRVKTGEGPVAGAGFVVDRSHLQYAGRLGLEETVDLVLQGHGRGGACADYLANTVDHLDALGLADRPLRRLLREVEARRGASGFGAPS